MSDIGYTVVDVILKLIIFAGVSAILLLLGAAIYAVWYWRNKK